MIAGASRRDDPSFGIVIPTWNNLDYLKLCVASIEANSAFDHEVIVHVNDGSDGTLDWVREKGLRHTWSADNLGVPLSVNLLASKVSRDWILYLNDDMWVCPGWDTALVERIAAVGTDRIFLCSRLIEPVNTGDARVRVLDCGRGPDDFDAGRLLADCRVAGRDERFVFSQPTLLSRTLWHLVGGYSIEFSPGMSSDDDLIMKLLTVGVDEFHLVEASRVYHFACRSTGRIRKNRGSREFLLKWGVRWKAVRDLHRAAAATGGEPPLVGGGLVDRLRRAWYALSGGYPLADIQAWNPLPTCDIEDHTRARDAGRPNADVSAASAFGANAGGERANGDRVSS